MAALAIAEGLPQPLPRAPEQRLWHVLRGKTQPASYADLYREAYLEPEMLFELIERWASASLLLVQVNPVRFIMNERARSKARPPIERDRFEVANPRSGRRRMWSAMKVLKEFDLPTIMMAAEVTRPTAYYYLDALEAAGFIQTNADPRSDRLIHKLVRNSGPRHPTVAEITDRGAKCLEVRDGNTRQAYRFPRAKKERLGKAPCKMGGVS